MATHNANAGRKVGGKVKFPTIGADAQALGLSTSYLWCLLTGRRPDTKGIVAEYWKLKRTQARKLLEETSNTA
jgi:hypothetical protein